MTEIFERISASEMEMVAVKILELAKNFEIITFRGQLGAGKTTLVQQMAIKMGVAQKVQSPTFSIVNEYQTRQNEIIYHFDCYRLKNVTEAYDFGMEEYLDSGNLCLIEWPEIIEPLMLNPYLDIEISLDQNNTRKITLKTKFDNERSYS